METSEINSKKIDQIKNDTQLLIESKQAATSDTSNVDSDGQHQLLLNLLSQIECLKELEPANQSHPMVETKDAHSDNRDEIETNSRDEPETFKSNTNTGVDAEVVVKQLKKLEKQNRTTHWLLSSLIVLTIAWQVSEVSLLLKLKQGLNNPFKSVGNMIAGIIKRPRPKEEEAQKSLLAKVNGSMDLSGLVNGGDQ